MDTTISLQSVLPARPQPKQATTDTAVASGNTAPPEGKDLPPPPTIESVEQAVKQINTYLAETQRNLSFQIHDASGRTILRVINPETDEVIRQVPSEEVLALAAALKERGLQLIDDTA